MKPRLTLARRFPVGSTVDFHAWDRETYRATVEAVRRGIVTISYTVAWRTERVTAYLDRAAATVRLHPTTNEGDRP